MPFLAQRRPVLCHRLNLRVRITLCQKRTPSSSAPETAHDTGAVTRPVEPWDRVVECLLQQRNRGSGGKTRGTGAESGVAVGGAEDSSGETGESGCQAVALDGKTVDSGSAAVIYRLAARSSGKCNGDASGEMGKPELEPGVQ